MDNILEKFEESEFFIVTTDNNNTFISNKNKNDNCYVWKYMKIYENKPRK